MALDHVVTVRDLLDMVEIAGFSTAGVCACIWAYLHLTEKWKG